MRTDVSKKIAKATPKKGPSPVVIGAVVAAVLIVGVVVAIVIAANSGKTGTAAGGSEGEGDRRPRHGAAVRVEDMHGELVRVAVVYRR